jgi:hypothetical protein
MKGVACFIVHDASRGTVRQIVPRWMIPSSSVSWSFTTPWSESFTWNDSFWNDSSLVTGPYPEPTDSTLPQPISLRPILIPSWNNPFLHWESYNTHKYKTQSCLFIVKAAGTHSYHSVLNGKPLDHDVRYNCMCNDVFYQLEVLCAK